MPSPRVAHCIFCDDIRFERGNKVSFMGLYGNDLVVSAPKPARLRLAIVTWVISDIDDSPTEVRIWATGPVADQKLFEGLFKFPEAPTETDATKTHLRAHMVLDGLEVAEDGVISVFVEAPSGPIRAGRLHLRFGQHTSDLPLDRGILVAPKDEDKEAIRKIAGAASSEEPKGAPDTSKRKKRKEPKGGSSSEQRLRAPLSRVVRKAKGKKL